MNERPSEKQIAIKLNEYYISQLDDLAKRGHTNRRQLMMNFIKLWMDELERSNTAIFFHLAIILRGIEVEMRMDFIRKREFLESYIPEKPFPIILTGDDDLQVGIAASKASMSKHHMMKNMIVTGIEELDAITDYNEFQFSDVEEKLKKSFGIIMAKAFMAFKEGIKDHEPLKRKGSKSSVLSSLGAWMKKRK
jgi:hypothetical protein